MQWPPLIDVSHWGVGQTPWRQTLLEAAYPQRQITHGGTTPFGGILTPPLEADQLSEAKTPPLLVLQTNGDPENIIAFPV